MKLAEIESFFYGSVCASSPPRAIEDVFVGTPQFGAIRRMSIYHSAYWARKRRTLAETFPHVVKILGEDRFVRLATEYLAEFPGRNAAIEYLGERFPTFLERRADLPGLVSWLAKLEWARTESLLAPDAVRVLQRSDLGGLDVAMARARLVPHVRVLRLPPSTLSYVAGAAMEGAADGATAERRVCTVVWRHLHAVRQRAFDDPEGLAIESAASGASLAEVCEAFGDGAPIDEVAGKIGAWVDRGWLEPFDGAFP
jgi:hypothetical protein